MSKKRVGEALGHLIRIGFLALHGMDCHGEDE